jgi:arginine decarboxylase-like protein
VGDEESQKLVLMIAELSSKVQIILDKQEELAENVSKIKEAVYNPDKGLYARLGALDVRLQTIERWKDVNTKMLWVGATVVMGLVVSKIWAVLV